MRHKNLGLLREMRELQEEELRRIYEEWEKEEQEGLDERDRYWDKKLARETGAVYFVEDPWGAVKIGYVYDEEHVPRRLKELRTSNPWDLRVLRSLSPLPSLAEKQLHEVFAEYRIRNEWFERDPVLGFLADHEALGVFTGTKIYKPEPFVMAF